MTNSSPETDAKTILLLRHAKSAWGLDVDDHDRPLSGRGKRDAVAVGELLAARDLNPDLVVCSTATRARETWLRAVKGGAQAGQVRYSERVYEAPAADLAKVIRKTPDDARSVLLIGHAPGIPDLVEYLAVRTPADPAWKRMEEKFPTSGLAILQFRGAWSDAGRQRAELIDFEVPRGAKNKAKK
jgi:phosphohistidine phosphatase